MLLVKAGDTRFDRLARVVKARKEARDIGASQSLCDVLHGAYLAEVKRLRDTYEFGLGEIVTVANAIEIGLTFA